jgi:hypothetical protein
VYLRHSSDSLITNGLRFCIYKYWLMTKDFQASIYKLETGSKWVCGLGETSLVAGSLGKLGTDSSAARQDGAVTLR